MDIERALIDRRHGHARVFDFLQVRGVVVGHAHALRIPLLEYLQHGPPRVQAAQSRIIRRRPVLTSGVRALGGRRVVLGRPMHLIKELQYFIVGRAGRNAPTACQRIQRRAAL